MKLLNIILLLISITLVGCDTMHGVSRAATIPTLPNLQRVKAKIESYSEIKEVKLCERSGSRPLTLTGIKKAEEVFYFSYSDHEKVNGTLRFSRDYKGKVYYSQYLCDINRSPPQEWIDTTWPVMKKIENDLINEFRLPEIRDTLKVKVVRVEDPERIEPNK